MQLHQNDVHDVYIIEHFSICHDKQLIGIYKNSKNDRYTIYIKM